MAINVSLASYNVKERESFIVDTNVWIYLFSPFSASTHGYDIFLADTQKKNCKLFVNSQIISEYVNVICRTAYQQYLRTNHLQQRNFKFKKDYQKTSDFDRYYKIAIDSVQNDILKHSKIIPIKLWHIRESLSDYHLMKDFNDLVYTKMLTNSIKIVSHDNDFNNHPEDIVWLHY